MFYTVKTMAKRSLVILTAQNVLYSITPPGTSWRPAAHIGDELLNRGGTRGITPLILVRSY